MRKKRRVCVKVVWGKREVRSGDKMGRVVGMLVFVWDIWGMNGGIRGEGVMNTG